MKTKIVTTLIGHRQVDLALECLGSLHRLSGDPVMLRIHDDGSLTAPDVERLRASLPVAEVVPRAVADAQMAERLAKFPFCSRLRHENPLGLKLFDVVLTASHSVVYCDTDILFLAPFRGLFGATEHAERPLFLADRQNAYCVRSWQVATRRRLSLSKRLNSGVIRCSAQILDLELVEWYLRTFQRCLGHPWVEQSCWALLGRQAGATAVVERQICLPDPQGAARPAIAVHLASPVRGLLPHYAALARSAGNAPPIEIVARPLGTCHSWELLRDEVRRYSARKRRSTYRVALPM